MIFPLDINKYKQHVADTYNCRSLTYDNSNWHHHIAQRLVNYAQLSPDQYVLDIATGTGMVAIEAAQIVGTKGKVIGVDISTGMLEQAKHKAKVLGLTNIEFQLADAEALELPANSVDRVLCGSAFIWMSDLIGVLRLWHRFLKPNGSIGIHAFADTAFIGGIVAQKVAERHGVVFEMSTPTGSVEKCRNLFLSAGFEAIEVEVEQHGSYISLEKAKAMWTGSSNPVPGQFPNPLSQLTSENLVQVKAEFEAELEALQTNQGIWNDITTFYVFAWKQAEQVL